MAVKRLTSLTITVLITICLMSCVSTMGCFGCSIDPRKVQPPFSLKPQESFGLVLVTTEMEPAACMFIGSPTKVCKVEELGLDRKTASSIGSSMVVGHFNNETYVLTAAHVCTELQPYTTFTLKVTDQISASVRISQKVTELKVADYSGKERSAEVYRVDRSNDLCMIKTKGTWGKPFTVSDRDPEIGEKVYNVASPHRIWAPGMVLMMDGYYSGKNSIGFYHYTIPARPGSSGSAILNYDGEIVGMVQRAVVGFENLAISTSTQAIREILDTIPVDEPSQNKSTNPTKLDVFTL